MGSLVRRAAGALAAVVLAGGMAGPAGAAVGPPAAAGRVLVGFAPGAGSETAALVGRAGGRVRSTIGGIDVAVVDVPAAQAGVVRSVLAGSPLVRFVEDDPGLRLADVVPNDPYFPYTAPYGGQWGNYLTQAPSAWGITTGSTQITIAVIDTGIAAHPDLTGQVLTGHNVLDGSTNTDDTNGHGTEVAGVVAAATNNGQGVAGYCWNCRLLPVKIATGSTANISDVATGITWAVDHGARVLNISLAGTSTSSTLASAVSYAQQHGAVVVAAAGNSGCNCPNYPAAYPGVVGVAASDQTDTLYSYSDYGSWVPLAAPGQNTTTTLTDPKTGAQWGYAPIGGTSLATPVVAGIAGLLLSTNPTASPSSVAAALDSGVDPVNGTHPVAYGRVNAAKALAAFGAASPPPAAPANTAPPTISGTAQDGQTLSASTGTWSGSPTAYGYQWQRCASDGTSCSAIGGATGPSYVVVTADVGSTLDVAVTASNSAGSGSATSAPTAVVVAAPAASMPLNTAPPTISGTARQGQTLTASTGTWSNSPTGYANQWLRCGSGCAAIAGATGSTYVAVSADVGSTLEVAVTASNSAGSATAVSSPTASVAALVVTQTFSGSLNGKTTSISFPTTVGAGTAQSAVSFSSKCSTLTLTVLNGGSVIGQSSGPSVLSRTDTLAAGSYSWQVSGTCKTSVTLNVTAPSA